MKIIVNEMELQSLKTFMEKYNRVTTEATVTVVPECEYTPEALFEQVHQGFIEALKSGAVVTCGCTDDGQYIMDIDPELFATYMDSMNVLQIGMAPHFISLMKVVNKYREELTKAYKVAKTFLCKDKALSKIKIGAKMIGLGDFYDDATQVAHDFVKDEQLQSTLRKECDRLTNHYELFSTNK
jgi:hypothetical protein